MALHAILALTSARDMSETLDEPGHLQVGEKFLHGQLDHFSMQRMPVSALNVAPMALADRMGVSLDAPQRLFASRLPTIFISVLTGLLIAGWAKEFYGNGASLVAAALWALDPTVLAHCRLATNDVYAAGAMVFAVWMFERWRQRSGAALFLLSAAVTGLAQMVKHTALLLGPILGCLWLLDAAPRWVAGARENGARSVVRPLARTGAGIALYCLVGLVALDLGYGFQTVGAEVWQYQLTNPLLVSLTEKVPELPVPLPRQWLEALRFGSRANATPGIGHGLMYLLDELRLDPWPHYFLVASLIKFPLPLLILALSATISLVRAGPKALRREAPIWLPATIVFAFFSLLCNVQIGVRYLLPMLPFVHVLAARVGATCSLPMRWLVVALLGWQAASVLSYHPHYLPYMNEIVWDRTRASHYLADSNLDWGQADVHLDRWLAKRGRPVSVRPEGPVSGTVVVGVNQLVGVIGGPGRYRWLRKCCEPSDHIAHAYLVYEVPDDVFVDGSQGD